MAGRCYRDQMKRHAIYRMYERYGLVLSFPEYNALCATIAARPGEHCATGYGKRLFFRVVFRHVQTIALWDTEHQAIVTFVPRLPLHTAVEVSP